MRTGVISEPKTFTFGDESLRGALDAKYDYCESFRLVGGSSTVRERAVSLTELEQKRFDKWHGAIRRLRHAPVPWKPKAKMLWLPKRNLSRDSRVRARIDSPVMWTT